MVLNGLDFCQIGGHGFVDFGVLIHLVDKGDDMNTIVNQTLAGRCIGDVRHLGGRDGQDACQGSLVICGLGQHLDKLAVGNHGSGSLILEDIGDILGNAGGDAAVLSGPLVQIPQKLRTVAALKSA